MSAKNLKFNTDKQLKLFNNNTNVPFV